MRKRRTLLEKWTDEFVAGDPKRQTMMDDDYANIQAGQMIYDLRTNAGLTQAQLARKIGTTASVISRLESADYSGHTLSMLNKIASALGQRIVISARPKEAA